MPPWVALAPRSISRLNGRAFERITPFSCRCRFTPLPSRQPNLRGRSASTQVSPTAINLRPNIPPRNKELHNALSALNDVVETYGSRDRLQLALKGLAEQDAVVRVAVLGLNSQLSAQRLARLLLADPLGVEEQWEKELERPDDERAVLLKFGDPADAQPPNRLFKTLAIPSRVLRSHNMEILITTLNVNASRQLVLTPDSSEESILVPKLQAPTARALPVPYPVHKTLIFGEGLDSAIAFGKFTSDIEDLPAGAKFAVNLPAPADEVLSSAGKGSAVINIEAGTQAVAVFRESIKNSIAYERGWFKSGLPTLSEWLVQDLQPSQPMKPVMRSLITSIADTIETDLQKEETQRLQALASIPAAREASSSISSHLSTWAEKSHTELRDELDEAFAARNWHKLAWWKLLWRVDDVSMISSEILERRWLTSAEKSSIYLAGRMKQAGFPDDIQSLPVAHESEAMANETESVVEKVPLDLSTDIRKSQPWFEYISSARAELINDTVPALQALAQRLLLQTFSTTSLSSAASALLYISVSSFSLFEASAVGVLGLTFSLRRMQKMWEGARESWEGTVREQGRSTLKRTEDLVRGIITMKEREKVGLVGDEDSAVKRRREAREKVATVRRILEEIEKRGVR